MTQFVTQELPLLSVLQDVLAVYDHRFLELAPDQRRRLVQSTRQLLGDEGLPPEVRTALPASYRLRAFCIQRGLHEELERLIAEEVTGHHVGAVVVGGRVYAMYPYLRGVPRQDADITDEVTVDHTLDALSWTGSKLRIRGRAAISRVETREYTITLAFRQEAHEHLLPTPTTDGTFDLLLDPAVLTPGPWHAHVIVQTLGVTRQSPYGTTHDPRFRPDPRERDGVLAHFTPTLTLQIPETPQAPGLLRRLFRRDSSSPNPRPHDCA